METLLHRNSDNGRRIIRKQTGSTARKKKSKDVRWKGRKAKECKS